jgi:hypothetical protein
MVGSTGPYTKKNPSLMLSFPVPDISTDSLIDANTGQPLIEMNTATINKLLTALNECTEWGQVGPIHLPALVLVRQLLRYIYYVDR